MKKKYTLLAIAALALSLFACEKEQVSIDKPSTPVNLTPEQKLDQLNMPAILFQYSYVNLETGEESGWIIDRSGYVKIYHSTLSSGATPSSENEKWNEAELASLYAKATETVSNIGTEELLSRAYQGLALSKKFLSGAEVNENANYIVGFYAFTSSTSSTSQSNHNQCSGAASYNNDTPGEASINRMIIGLSGHLNRHETSTYATNLHQWLVALNEGL